MRRRDKGRWAAEEVKAAFASLASAAVLIQIMFINPPVWFGMRLLTGTCFAGAFVIVESWLNARSDDNSRGRVLSIYMIVTFIGMACGQFLLDIATDDLWRDQHVTAVRGVVETLNGQHVTAWL